MTSMMGTHAETLFVSTADHAFIGEAMGELKANVDQLLEQARSTAQTAGHFSWSVSSVSHEVTPLSVPTRRTSFLGPVHTMTLRFVASALIVVSWETGLSSFE